MPLFVVGRGRGATQPVVYYSAPMRFLCVWSCLQKRARRAGLNMQKLRAAPDVSVLRGLASNTHMGYFYVEIPGVCTAQGQTIDRYLHVQVAGDSGKIPMNFGREVMAELIGEKDKVNWQTCVVPRDEEERLADVLRKLLGSC